MSRLISLSAMVLLVSPAIKLAMMIWIRCVVQPELSRTERCNEVGPWKKSSQKRRRYSYSTHSADLACPSTQNIADVESGLFRASNRTIRYLDSRYYSQIWTLQGQFIQHLAVGGGINSVKISWYWSAAESFTIFENHVHMSKKILCLHIFLWLF